MIAVQVFQALLFTAILGLPVVAWVLGRRSRKDADQKQTAGRRAALILLRIQTLLPLPYFVFDNLFSAASTASPSALQQFLARSVPIVFSSAILGEVLTIPVVWMWIRYGQGKERVISVLISVLSALFILLLVMVGGAAGGAA